MNKKHTGLVLIFFFVLLCGLILYELHGQEKYYEGFIDGLFVDIPDVYVRTCVYEYMYPYSFDVSAYRNWSDGGE